MYLNRGIIALLIITLQGLSSCTILQWRTTDEKILEQFEIAKIPTQISYVVVDSLDLKIRVQKVSSDTSRVNVVFFHGSPSSLSAWKGYLLNDTLRKSANLFAIDRPGYGYSNFGDEMTAIDTQAKVMSALIDHYQLKKVIVVGASYGGPLAAKIAALNKNVEGVLLISPAIDPKQEKHIKGVMWTQYWLTRWMVPTGYRVAGDEKVVHAAELTKVEPSWKEITVPVIHIHGDKDDIVPYGNVYYTKEAFNDIQIITAKNTGHEIAWGNPELIIPHLFNLIQKL